MEFRQFMHQSKGMDERNLLSTENSYTLPHSKSYGGIDKFSVGMQGRFLVFALSCEQGLWILKN